MEIFPKMPGNFPDYIILQHRVGNTDFIVDWCCLPKTRIILKSQSGRSVHESDLLAFFRVGLCVTDGSPMEPDVHSRKA